MKRPLKPYTDKIPEPPHGEPNGEHVGHLRIIVFDHGNNFRFGIASPFVGFDRRFFERNSRFSRFSRFSRSTSRFKTGHQNSRRNECRTIRRVDARSVQRRNVRLPRMSRRPGKTNSSKTPEHRPGIELTSF